MTHGQKLKYRIFRKQGLTVPQAYCAVLCHNAAVRNGNTNVGNYDALLVSGLPTFNAATIIEIAKCLSNANP